MVTPSGASRFGIFLFQGLLQPVTEGTKTFGTHGLFIPINNSLLPLGRPSFQIIPEQPPAVNVFMAIDAKVLPVASV